MFDGKTLIFAPHMDDEVLGCGGLLSDPGGSKHVHFLTDAHPILGNVSRDECQQVAAHNGHTISWDGFTANILHTEPIVRLINVMEATITRHRPDTVLLPFPDYNQDHRTVHAAGLTAVRPHDENHYVNNVLLYEMPCTHQGTYTQPFRPAVFLPINVEAKVELYELYASQVRNHRSCDTVRAIAAFRGMQCHKQFAEAYQVVRVTL